MFIWTIFLIFVIGHIVHNWKVRWFQLTPGTLSYFESQNSLTKPLGCIPLVGSTVKLVPSTKNVQNCFKLTSIIIHKSYYIQGKLMWKRVSCNEDVMIANSQPELIEWVQAIGAASKAVRQRKGSGKRNWMIYFQCIG